MHRNLKMFVATTALVGISTMSYAVGPTAATNGINIDVGTSGSVASLSISQDSTNVNNNVSGNGTTSAFNAKGLWQTIAIGQTGNALKGSNVLKGGIATMGGATGNTLNATYATTGDGDNIHSLTIVGDGTTGPSATAVTVGMSNNGATPNTLTDALTASGALVYKLSITGTGNTVTNTLTGGAVTLQGAGGTGTTLAITGDSNTISNVINTGTGAITLGQTVSGNGNTLTNQGQGSGTFVAGSLVENVTMTGGTNSIINNSTGSGARTINATLVTAGNTVANTFTGTGDETATLTTDATSRVNYAMSTSGASTLASTILKGAIGVSGAAAMIQVSQTADTTNSNLTVSGGSGTIYTMGTSLAGGYGVSVVQASVGATLAANVTGNVNGYTASFKQ